MKNENVEISIEGIQRLFRAIDQRDQLDKAKEAVDEAQQIVAELQEASDRLEDIPGCVDVANLVFEKLIEAKIRLNKALIAYNKLDLEENMRMLNPERRAL